MILIFSLSSRRFERSERSLVGIQGPKRNAPPGHRIPSKYLPWFSWVISSSSSFRPSYPRTSGTKKKKIYYGTRDCRKHRGEMGWNYSTLHASDPVKPYKNRHNVVPANTRWEYLSTKKNPQLWPFDSSGYFFSLLLKRLPLKRLCPSLVLAVHHLLLKDRIKRRFSLKCRREKFSIFLSNFWWSNFTNNSSRFEFNNRNCFFLPS